MPGAGFWIDLAERALRGFAQGAVGALVAKAGVKAVTVPVMSLPWLFAAEVGASAAIVSLLMGLAAMKVGDQQTASFLPADKSGMMMRLRRPFRGAADGSPGAGKTGG